MKNLIDRNIINYIINSKYSDLISSLLIGVGYLTMMVFTFIAYIK